MKGKLKNFFLDLLFPKFCLNCKRERSFLCEDCKATLDITNFHQKFQIGELSDLYYPLEYKNPLIKNLIKHFKYEPFVKELTMPLASLITDHFQLLECQPDFSNFILIPVPLEKRKLKWRGFNQAEEVGRELSKFLNPVRDSGNKGSLQKENISNGVNIEILNNVLIKIKETPPQVELSAKERKENIKGVFKIEKPEKIRGRKILLVDDVYTTGSTMEEAARVLKKAGVKEVIGIVIARAKPEEDYFRNV